MILGKCFDLGVCGSGPMRRYYLVICPSLGTARVCFVRSGISLITALQVKLVFDPNIARAWDILLPRKPVIALATNYLCVMGCILSWSF